MIVNAKRHTVIATDVDLATLTRKLGLPRP